MIDNPVLLADTDLDEALRVKLQGFNIRYVAQLFAIRDKRPQLMLASHAVQMDPEALSAELGRICDAHPDQKPPEGTPEPRGMGYRA